MTGVLSFTWTPFSDDKKKFFIGPQPYNSKLAYSTDSFFLQDRIQRIPTYEIPRDLEEVSTISSSSSRGQQHHYVPTYTPVNKSRNTKYPPPVDYTKVRANAALVHPEDENLRKISQTASIHSVRYQPTKKISIV
jgi:hypothetical protein